MTACTIDEAVRRAIAVGAGIRTIWVVWTISAGPPFNTIPLNNPDGKHKAAQLGCVLCRALKTMCLAYGIPLLSGKGLDVRGWASAGPLWRNSQGLGAGDAPIFQLPV